MINILLGVTGSVAAVKAPELIWKLINRFGPNNVSIKVVLTQGGKNFWEKASTYDPEHWDKIQHIIRQNQDPSLHESADVAKIQVYLSDDEWKVWDKIGNPVEHIVLRDWATLCIIAPLSAHTLAKIANGLCDDMLSCIVRAWDFGHYNTEKCSTSEDHRQQLACGKPLVLAPAMNTAMWEHPLTAQQLNQIKKFSRTTNQDGQEISDMGCCVHIVPPQVKMLACGEMGVGAMADVVTIVEVVGCILAQPRPV